MREPGYLMTCHRCKKQEFVPKEHLTDWKGLALGKYGDEPVDICPSCARLFDRLAEVFMESYKDGVLAYLEDGTPLIFNANRLNGEDEKKVEKKFTDDIEECLEELRKTLKTATYEITANTISLGESYTVPSRDCAQITIEEEDEEDAN